MGEVADECERLTKAYRHLRNCIEGGDRRGRPMDLIHKRDWDRILQLEAALVPPSQSAEEPASERPPMLLRVQRLVGSEHDWYYFRGMMAEAAAMRDLLPKLITLVDAEPAKEPKAIVCKEVPVPKWAKDAMTDAINRALAPQEPSEEPRG